MPQAWTPKDERQYKHVKQSELERGRRVDEAKSIAARTVNNQRAAQVLRVGLGHGHVRSVPPGPA